MSNIWCFLRGHLVGCIYIRMRKKKSSFIEIIEAIHHTLQNGCISFCRVYFMSQASRISANVVLDPVEPVESGLLPGDDLL